MVVSFYLLIVLDLVLLFLHLLLMPLFEALFGNELLVSIYLVELKARAVLLLGSSFFLDLKS
ncbi:hypothetical protein Syun_010836 [Stephania yunnanensis]|uniref:Uncharacterized protein n=1 Tax=Stephania yunnanensis TaxID=152371 RepID=A0AAP0JWN5_9MAGN